jgi:hypothetical protein
MRRLRPRFHVGGNDHADRLFPRRDCPMAVFVTSQVLVAIQILVEVGNVRWRRAAMIFIDDNIVVGVLVISVSVTGDVRRALNARLAPGSGLALRAFAPAPPASPSATAPGLFLRAIDARTFFWLAGGLGEIIKNRRLACV